MIDQQRKWTKLGKARNHLEWEMYASTVNAYFNPPAQEIVFPAGIMRPPWYSVEWSVGYNVIQGTPYSAFNRPGYLNYGGMGAIAAHELTVCPTSLGPWRVSFPHYVACF
jgi:endothelin-converting enzyme